MNGVKGHIALIAVALAAAGLVHAQEPSAAQVAQERKDAELEVPKLAEVLELRPGMTVADVGAGGGAMAVVFAKWIGAGRVIATDVGKRQIGLIRNYVKREGLTNVSVSEGAAASANLPAACCDAVFLRNVYHHLTVIEPFNKSLRDALKPGGRLAIIDGMVDKNAPVPAGVPANRGGHGINSSLVIAELVAAGFIHVRTFDRWPPEDTTTPAFLALFRKP
jgi:SAM-dependent methyltransferase